MHFYVPKLALQENLRYSLLTGVAGSQSTGYNATKKTYNKFPKCTLKILENRREDHCNGVPFLL